MRSISDHKVDGCNARICILADYADDRGCSIYTVSVPGQHGESEFRHVLTFQKGAVADVGIVGLTNEVLLAVVLDRLRVFQRGQFSCRQNALVITKLEEALHWLMDRSREIAEKCIEPSESEASARTALRAASHPPEKKTPSAPAAKTASVTTFDSSWAHEQANKMAVARPNCPQQIDLPMPDGVTTGRVVVVPSDNWDTPESALSAVRASLVASMLYGYKRASIQPDASAWREKCLVGIRAKYDWWIRWTNPDDCLFYWLHPSKMRWVTEPEQISMPAFESEAKAREVLAIAPAPPGVDDPAAKRERDLLAAIDEANEALRSANSIAGREGECTRWVPFKNQIEGILEKQHAILYPRADRRLAPGS